MSAAKRDHGLASPPVKPGVSNGDDSGNTGATKRRRVVVEDDEEDEDRSQPKRPQARSSGETQPRRRPEGDNSGPANRPRHDVQSSKLRSSDAPLPLEPTPPPRSPPRKRKRPTAAARVHVDDEAIKRRRQEREERARQNEQAPSQDVSAFVKQHYNLVPERDRKWRQTDSKIKGLRSFNNWVKACLIRKFTPTYPGVAVLDIGCGKGGDLQKWKSSRVSTYIGLDAADVSIGQAWERFRGMQRQNRGLRASFHVHDCFGRSVQEVPQVREIGFNPSAEDRWNGGGFDMVSMMFCMHYSFESEEKARIMLRNAAGALKKGGHFIGVIPNSDVIAAKIQQHYSKKAAANGGAAAPPVEEDDDDDWDPEKSVEDQEKEKKPEASADGDAKPADGVEEEEVKWGNDIYSIRFPPGQPPPKDGVFRPAFGWKYFYYLEEAVEAPEYVVPWGVFRGLAEDFNFSLSYMEPFSAVWESERRNRESEQLAERMRVTENGRLNMSADEVEATNFYLAFAFEKI